MTDSEPLGRPRPARTDTLLARVLPRSFAPRVEQARRDALTLYASLRGRHPAPLIDRPPRPSSPAAEVIRPAAGAAGIEPRALRVTRVVRETPDAVSLYLDDPSGKPLEFLPGQFLTVLVDVGGETLRRAYSLASPALPGEAPHVTVKRIAGGRVSNHINDHVQAGQVLRVLGPSGSFTVNVDPEVERRVVMLAGGSGITPILSIAHTVLAREPKSTVTLIYGNRRVEDIIFRERLEDLEAEHGDRLQLDHVLSDPPEAWPGGTGLLDEATVTARLEALGVADTPATEYFVCGPTPMMEAVHASLGARGVPASRIREERFVRPEERRGPGELPSDPQPVRVRLGGTERSLLAEPGQTVLESGLAAGLPMPFSCTMGGCGACKVRLVDGQVDMEEPNCLTPEERAKGHILACVSRPCSNVTVEVEGS